MLASRASLLLPLAIGLVGGCQGAPRGVVAKCEDSLGLPPEVSTDILFVVDNSNSMSEEQAKVVAELSTFIDSLSTGPVENDFQVGVVSTSVSLYAAACGVTSGSVSTLPEEAGRLQLGKDLDGEVVPASRGRILASGSADLLEQFELLVGQGIAGLGQEMGLEAARLALSEPLASTPTDDDPTGNLGFLRPGSRLLVVIVSDEDDCSSSDAKAVLLHPACSDTACDSDADCTGTGTYCLPRDEDPSDRVCLENACETRTGRAALEPVADYVEFLKTLDDGTRSGRTRDVSLAVIAPVDAVGNPTRCRSDSDEAQGVGERYAEAVEMMGDRGYIDSICNDDYSATLRKIAELVSAPQVLELPGNPPDGSLIQIELERDGSSIRCRNGDGFTFEGAEGSLPARVTMQDQCRLRADDTIDIKFVCSG